MKHILLGLSLLFISTLSFAQTKANKKTKTQYPASFSIGKNDYNNLFNIKTGELVKTPSNKYLNKSVLQLNSVNGDMHLLKYRLSFFPKSSLMIQVNAQHSTQIFIVSDDKSVFYKGRIEKEQIVMTKCSEDDIVSE